MASTGSGRGPIKVGSGYIDVFPKINQKQLRETKAQLEKQMGATGKKAGKAFSDGIVSQVSQIPKKAKAAADKAQREIQKSSQDSKKVLKRIEQEITREYGKEAGKRFREFAKLEKQKQKLTENTSNSTRRALRDTERLEDQHHRRQGQRWRTAERSYNQFLADRNRADQRYQREAARREELALRSYQQFLRDRERAAARTAREEARAHRRAHLQMREDIRRTLMEARSARLADLRSQMDTHRDQLASLRSQLTSYRRQMDDHTRSVGRGLANVQTAWRRQGESISQLGTNITETGRLITANLLGPLGMVSAALTGIGVQSADMRILGQMGLGAAGVSSQKSAKEMRRIQQYAIDTPFSIETMHEYQMKIIRSLAGADDTWYKGGQSRTNAANRAAGKTSDIIMAVGDSMARAGNLDPEMFKRAMYAVDRMLDMDKAPTRSINQLVQASGISASELAQMFGFNSAGDFWEVVGTPVAKGGGVKGQDMIDNLLRYWDPNYFKLDKNGKPVVDPKTGLRVTNPNSDRTGGSAGFGEQMTSATISGRVSQIKERAQYELGSLFASEDPETGEYRYTGLGEAIMGKRTPVMKKGPDGSMVESGEYTYEGGLLQQIQELGEDQKGNIVKLLTTAFEAVGTFVDQLQWFSDWLEAHPQVKEVFANLLKMAAVAMPFIIAIGLLTKTFGLVNKIFASALKPVAGLFKGARAATRGARQVASGVQSRRNGGTFREGYRDRRTQLRDGDVRGPVARARDRITGRDSGANQLRQSIRDTEDAIRETEDGIRDLQRQIRDTNATSIRQLVDRFAGTGPDSLQGAANNAGNQINQVQNQTQQLNRQTLSTVVQQYRDLEAQIKDVVQRAKDVVQAVKDADKEKLTSLKLQFDGARGAADDTRNAVTDVSSAVGNLNRRSLESLQGQFRETSDTADTLRAKVNQAIRAVGNLNSEKLGTLRKEFKSLHTAVNDVHKLVGTTKSGLAGRVSNLDDRKLSKVIRQVNDLKEALDKAGNEANTLNNRLDDISNHAPGNSGSSSGSNKKPKKKKNRASGGVLEGHSPGVDIHRFESPTGGVLNLSGGEAVMRPEWTDVVGESTVNRWNAIARTQGAEGLRREMSFANGGILDKLGIQPILDKVNSYQVGWDVAGASQTMRMDETSDAIGGPARQGILGGGTSASHFVGGDLSGRFRGMYDFMTKDSWDLLKRLPIPNGLTQIIGTVAGAVAPSASEHFWDDVWKGSGNILERGQTFLGHMFAPENLDDIVMGALEGAWDSVSGIVDTAKALITDPSGAVNDAVDGVFEFARSQYDGLIAMTKGIREIWQNPSAYASQVVDDIYSRAKEALPNLEGLFDFSGDKLIMKKPDTNYIMDEMFSRPGMGDAVTRWIPQVKMVLSQLGLPQSDLDLVLHRIKVESGGNPKAINLWDSNAKAGIPSQGLMQTIPPTFAAYAGPYKSRGITDPLASIYAGLNYAVHRYGSGWRKALSGYKGYWTGTMSASPGLALVGERGPELVDFGKGGQRVYDARETDSMLSGGRNISITVQEAKHENTPQSILRGLQWIDSMYGNRL
ncbi:transglycosylase SLT domain-containing protein [Streptomyces althioticus]|uniref:Transglycosylase SLT domain-containing protein n=1 Tax=Streptomyces althioticus TaxID=83380 RepID=A0ABZ1YE05_9ACTN